ncbi:MAG: 2-oxoglutarate dehydrogenase E1 component [Akkermansia sp.]
MSSSIFARLSPEQIERLYKNWSNDPESVEPVWAAYFEGYALGALNEEMPIEPIETESSSHSIPSEQIPPLPQQDPCVLLDETSSRWRGLVAYLMDSYRVLGHRAANFNPLYPPDDQGSLPDPSLLGFSNEDMRRPVNMRGFHQGEPSTLGDILAWLRACYCGHIGFEYMHIDDLKIRSWVEHKIEERADLPDYGANTRKQALNLLTRAELFEEFLGKKFIGEKRFSLEGGEGFSLLLNAVLESASRADVQHAEIGMAHRGRLNTLANILHKPLASIFYEFTSSYLPDSPTGGNDVKYHKGYESIRSFDGKPMLIHMASNPSHLEAVDPILEGRARAIQHDTGDKKRTRTLPILVHGDAAFAGQGLVCEVFNLSQLRGFHTGGTIHIIINNQIGFTTNPDEARSSRYATDVAKTTQSPILHINGEKPEDLIWAAQFAIEFRQHFGKDIVLDMYCYRRLGHNEMDQAEYTSPIQSKLIKQRQPVAKLYAQELIQRHELTELEWTNIQQKIWEMMEHELDSLSSGSPHTDNTYNLSSGKRLLPYSHDPVDTGISADTIAHIGQSLTTLPKNFTIHPNLAKRFMQRRINAFTQGTSFDWGMAEALAWGSLLLEGTPVRISGQDCQRGTFSHRYAVLHDTQTGNIYIPLEHISENQADFRIFNSALSEASVLGFEYGYSVASPQTLVMWEAQFGDFANGAQVIIDQFISSAETKWNRSSAITLLLPHGYEGAGSEHSSGRIERYLQLCADRNMQILNLTTPSQFFHALRRQIKQNCPKPLILFTPKSLLSHPEAISPHQDFLPNTSFREILPDPESPAPQQVKHAIFCSGKIYYELIRHRREEKIDDTLIIRIEQIYPLDEDLMSHILAPYNHIRDFCWCQEEPENMGAWIHLRTRLGHIFAASFRYAGRPMMACPAEGAKTLYLAAQQRLIRSAFGVRPLNDNNLTNNLNNL